MPQFYEIRPVSYDGRLLQYSRWERNAKFSDLGQAKWIAEETYYGYPEDASLHPEELPQTQATHIQVEGPNGYTGMYDMNRREWTERDNETDR